MVDYPRGTVAFLFTDIEGSTRLWETEQPAMQTAVERHFAILREAIAAQHGVLFKTIGDAAQAAFATVPEVVAAAAEAQAALRQDAWGATGPLRVRMAIHVGEAIPRDGDYLAPALNRLARVLGAGHGEQILLTEAARALAAPLPNGHALHDLGPHRLRDLLEAERIFQLCGPGLREDFPPLRVLDRHPHNLPAQPTPIVGREDDLAALRALIVAPGTRLVTLLGAGGTGKTRLALQAAAEVLEHFPDGAWWAPLAIVRDPALVPQAIAATLGVRENLGEPLAETLAAHLAGRRVLLLLDNVEQVIDTALIIQRLLDAAPGVVVLATSREPLRLRVEREFPIAPLPLPPAGARIAADQALTYPAVRLFVERAQAVKPGFALDERNVADVVAICHRLDGLPLAIELAAARVRLLPPAALLTRLDRRLALLTGGARDLPERQQTLRATIAWSHDLLDPAERALFARLALFAGGFALEAADAVCGAAGGLPLDLLDGIDSLVQQSLLRLETGPAGESRFTMLETIREFALERLQELPEAEQLRQTHADFFLALAEGTDWDDVAGRGELVDRLGADHANLRQALSFYEQLGGAGLVPLLRLATALGLFWWLRGYFAEGRGVLERALAAPGDVPAPARAAAVIETAFLAEAQGEMTRAQALQEEALALYQSAADVEGEARAVSALGQIARQRGDFSTARSREQAALEAWRRAGDVAGTAGALMELGLLRQLEGDYTGAEPELRESLRLFRQVRDELGEAHALNRLGLLAMSTGRLEEAVARFEESLRLWRGLDNRQMLASDLHNLGEARHLSGSLDEAERLYQEALAHFEELGDLRGRGFALCHLGLLALDRENSAAARELLLQSLRLRWGAGLRASAADTLEALAEATWRLGDSAGAAVMLRAGLLLREETGLARQPVYEERYRRVAQGVTGVTTPEPFNLDAAVAALIDARQPATVTAAG
jgi:predicted ATPase/class 3 adenylate cyclase